MSGGAVTGPVRIWLRLEGLVVFLLGACLYTRGDGSWLLFAALFFVPDVSFAGYVGGPRVGAVAYNLAHSYVGPVTLGASLLSTGADLSIAFIWAAHIGFDRALGYGSKYPTAFSDTHLGRIGRGDSHPFTRAYGSLFRDLDGRRDQGSRPLRRLDQVEHLHESPAREVKHEYRPGDASRMRICLDAVVEDAKLRQAGHQLDQIHSTAVEARSNRGFRNIVSASSHSRANPRDLQVGTAQSDEPDAHVDSSRQRIVEKALMVCPPSVVSKAKSSRSAIARSSSSGATHALAAWRPATPTRGCCDSIPQPFS
jgi:hypothetical protein